MKNRKEKKIMVAATLGAMYWVASNTGLAGGLSGRWVSVRKSVLIGGVLMSTGAWIMLFLYIVGLGGGSIFLITYSLRHNDI